MSLRVLYYLMSRQVLHAGCQLIRLPRPRRPGQTGTSRLPPQHAALRARQAARALRSAVEIRVPGVGRDHPGDVRVLRQAGETDAAALYRAQASTPSARKAAVTDSKSRHDRVTQDEHERIEASWRERALNAEEQLTISHKKILAQRLRIGELMGQLRDFEQMVPGESVQRITTENATLKRRVQQLSQEHRALQERLEGARSNLRFADKRIADLEAQLLEQG